MSLSHSFRIEVYFFRGKGRKVEIADADDLHVAHSPEEHVPIVELEALPEKIAGWVEGE